MLIFAKDNYGYKITINLASIEYMRLDHHLGQINIWTTQGRSLDLTFYHPKRAEEAYIEILTAADDKSPVVNILEFQEESEN
jgi:hypothetical protein